MRKTIGKVIRDLLSVSKKEIIENTEDDGFFRRFGNPVIFEDEKLVLMSFELYERLFGKTDLSKEQTLEVKDFVKLLKESEENAK